MKPFLQRLEEICFSAVDDTDSNLVEAAGKCLSSLPLINDECWSQITEALIEELQIAIEQAYLGIKRISNIPTEGISHSNCEAF
jgi:hypothetical protein